MTWDDITLQQFLELSRIDKEDEIEKSAAAIDIIFPEAAPSIELPFSKFDVYLKQLGFLSKSMPEKKLADKYVINKTSYILHGNVFTATTAQIIDFRAAIKGEHYDYASAIACFMIPEGHKYNDGYDMDKVLNDMKTLPITDVTAICNFFIKSFSLSMRILVDYFQKVLKRLKPKKNKEMEEDLEKMEQIMKELSMTYFQ